MKSWFSNSGFIEMGYVKKTRPMNIGDYWDGYWDALKKYPMEARTEYTDEEFCAALEGYRNQSIQKSVYSKNPIVKMFALLDKRVGRRTLEKIEEEIHSQPEWVRFFYEVRCNR